MFRSDFARRYLALGFAEGFAEGFPEGFAEGYVEGVALAVLAVLRHRGVAVPAAAEERIMRCTGVEQAYEWLDRAGTVGSVDELFV